MPKEIEIKFPCGLWMKFEVNLIKGLKEDEKLVCPMHKKRCYRKQQEISKIVKMQKSAKQPGILTTN